MLTTDEVARRLRRNPYLVRRWLEQGRLRGGKVGPIWTVTEREIARFLRDEPVRVRRPKEET